MTTHYKCVSCGRTWTDQQNSLRHKTMSHLKPLNYGYKDCKGRIIKIKEEVK